MILDDLLWWEAFNRPTQAGVTGDLLLDFGGGLLIATLGLTLVFAMAAGVWSDRDPEVARRWLGPWAGNLLVLVYGVLMALAVLWLVIPGMALVVVAWNEPLLWSGWALGAG